MLLLFLLIIICEGHETIIILFVAVSAIHTSSWTIARRLSHLRLHHIISHWSLVGRRQGQDVGENVESIDSCYWARRLFMVCHTGSTSQQLQLHPHRFRVWCTERKILRAFSRETSPRQLTTAPPHDKTLAAVQMLFAHRTTSRHRMLRLEVVWSTVSRREADTFVLSPGSVVERIQGRLSQFETFRAFWEQENRRKSIREEWALLCGGGG